MRVVSPKILGRVETPRAVARALAVRTLDGLHGEPLRVLDPAVGNGALLLAAAFAARKLGKRVVLSGLDKDPQALEGARMAVLAAGVRATLRSGDALERWGGRADRHPVGFDAVLANPPWVSFSGRERVPIAPEERERLRERFESFHGWPSLQGPFLELSLGLVRPGGRVGFVLPRAALDLERYGALRRVATARARVLWVEDLGESVFPGVCQGAATVVLERMREGEEGPASEAAWLPVGSLPLWARRCLDRLERFPRFPRALVSDPGVHTGNAAARVLSSEPLPGFVPCREGKDVARFALAPPRLYVDPSPDLAEPLYATVRPPERYGEASILVRQTADRPIAARHAPWAYFRNSALAVAKHPELEVEVVLALLCSRLYALAHRSRWADARQRAFPQVKVSALAALPFPPSLPFLLREKIVSLVRARERARGEDVARLEASLERAVARVFGIDPDACSALLGFFG